MWCTVYSTLRYMKCSVRKFQSQLRRRTYGVRGRTIGALFRSPGFDLSHWNTRFLLSREPQLNDRDRHNGSVVLGPTQEGQSQQLSSREKMAPGMLRSSCYCWLMGIWEEGRWYGCRRMAQWGRSSCLFCHLKEEHSIWSMDRVLEVRTRQSGGERFVPPVTRSSEKRVCVMDVWYEAYRLRRVLIGIEQSCQSLFVSVCLLILVLKACQ